MQGRHLCLPFYGASSLLLGGMDQSIPYDMWMHRDGKIKGIPQDALIGSQVKFFVDNIMG